MQVLKPNNVKIYNLSAGKSLPEWLSDKRKRKLQKDDVALRRRVELIQDFTMPDVSNTVCTTPDGQYIYATGTYKPRLRCYDVENLAMKFERCVDSEIINMMVLSDDYEKVVLLQEDRWLEFHVKQGRYFRFRIPKFGRDLAYHAPSCDLYIVGAGSDIYRYNLELGRFNVPLSTHSRSLTSCGVNAQHYMFMCGTEDGQVEAWDPRSRERIGVLDCAMHCEMDDSAVIGARGVPQVSTLAFKDGLTMGVGMSTGHTLLFDIRSPRPLLVKDQLYGQPVRSIAFATSANNSNTVVSMDARAVKLWSALDGKPYTAIDPGVDLNQLCLIPGTGLMFIANESPKLFTYYIPDLGPAPRWCSFLDSITEELEETEESHVYDDYKFVTHAELNDLGLTHLVGSSVLRAYMHGYFIDIRLYKKARALVDPYDYKSYRDKKIREQVDYERTSRIVKKEVALASGIMQDDRFAQLWKDTDFEVDVNSEQYQLLNPARSKLRTQRMKGVEKAGEVGEELMDAEQRLVAADRATTSQETAGSDDDLAGTSSASESSSEDDEQYKEEVKTAHRRAARLRWERERLEEQQAEAGEDRWRMTEGAAVGTGRLGDVGKRLSDRLRENDRQDRGVVHTKAGASNSKEITFTIKSKRQQTRQERQEDHVRERRQARRSAKTLATKTKRAR